MVELPDMKQYNETEKFRLNAKKFFLTYPNTSKGFKVQKVLKAISEKAEIKYFLGSQEPHKSGRWHVHLYIEFFDKIDVKSPDYFDIEFYGNRHPNIQKPRNLSKLWRYIKKGGDYETNLPNDGEPHFEQFSDIEDDELFWRELLYNMKPNMGSSTYVRAIEQLRKSKMVKFYNVSQAENEGPISTIEYLEKKFGKSFRR